MENSMKSISTINPAIIGNIKWLIIMQNASKSLIRKWVCCVTMVYYYASFPAALNTFQ